MPPVYADSFSGITQGELGQAQLRQRGLESALAGAVQSIQQMKNRQMLADQFAQTMAQRGQQLNAEKEHWKAQAAQAGSELELRSSAEDRQGRYYDWLMSQDAPTKTRDRELDEKFLMSLGDTGQIMDESDAAKLAPNASPTARNIALQKSKMAQAGQEKDFQLSNALANALTMKSDKDAQIATLQKQNEDFGKVHLFFSGPTAAAHATVQAEENKKKIEQLTAEKAQIDRGLKPFQDNKLLDRYVQPSMEKPGAFEPAVPVPYHLQKRAAPVQTGTNPDTVLPSATVPNRRSYGLRPGGAPVPENNPPEGMITNAPTSTATQGGGDKKSWVINRAAELTKLGLVKTPAEAVARARSEYDANP